MTACPECHSEFTGHVNRVYCSDLCKTRHKNSKSASSRKAARAAASTLHLRTCKRCGVNIGDRGSRAEFCVNCTKASGSRVARPKEICAKQERQEPKRATRAARRAVKLAFERAANKRKAVAASKRYHGGIQPLNAGIQARIDAIVERAKQNGTCYGAG